MCISCWRAVRAQLSFGVLRLIFSKLVMRKYVDAVGFEYFVCRGRRVHDFCLIVRRRGRFLGLASARGAGWLLTCSVGRH